MNARILVAVATLMLIPTVAAEPITVQPPIGSPCDELPESGNNEPGQEPGQEPDPLRETCEEAYAAVLCPVVSVGTSPGPGMVVVDPYNCYRNLVNRLVGTDGGEPDHEPEEHHDEPTEPEGQ